MPHDLPASAPARDFRLTGLHVLTLFVAFFVVVASVNGYMMKMAISTMPGLDARNGYDESQKYNALIRRAEAQGERHWTPSATVSAADGRTAVTISFAGGPDEARQPLALTARFEHPATRALDVPVLVTAGPSGYQGSLPRELTGLWTLVIEAREPVTGEVLFQSRNRLTIRGSKP